MTTDPESPRMPLPQPQRLLPLPPLPPYALPPALEARAVRSATRAMATPGVRRLPDLALALYCLGELVHALRVVHVLP